MFGVGEPLYRLTSQLQEILVRIEENRNNPQEVRELSRRGQNITSQIMRMGNNCRVHFKKIELLANEVSKELYGK